MGTKERLSSLSEVVHRSRQLCTLLIFCLLWEPIAFLWPIWELVYRAYCCQPDVMGSMWDSPDSRNPTYKPRKGDKRQLLCILES